MLHMFLCAKCRALCFCAINYSQSRLHTSHVYLALTSSEPSDICTKESEAVLYCLVLTLTKPQPSQAGLWPGLHCAHSSTKLKVQLPLRLFLTRLREAVATPTTSGLRGTQLLFQLLPRRAWCQVRNMGTYVFHGDALTRDRR